MIIIYYTHIYIIVIICILCIENKKLYLIKLDNDLLWALNIITNKKILLNLKS